MARGFRSTLCLFLVSSLLVSAFCAPQSGRPRKDRYRPYRDEFNENDNDVQQSESKPSSSTASPVDDDDDDDDFGEMQVSPSTGGGSNIISLLNLATALFPGSSSSGANRVIRNMIRQNLLRYQQQVNIRRKDIADNTIDIGAPRLISPLQRQEDEDDHDDSDDDEDDDDDDNDEDSNSDSAEHNDAADDNDASDANDAADANDAEDANDAADGNDAAEESVENNKEDENDKASKQDSNGDDNDSDYSDEPEGDGQGGGVLGLLAGLSGGEGGSDLGTLLATVSQIAGDLSGGEGFDLNSVIASGFGLFVGLLSQGEENPGTVISSYFLTSLDSITGGGAKNNGAFFGKFLSNLIKGTSAAEGGSDESSEENGEPKMTMADSAGFFASLLMSLSGDMSKGSSDGSSSHPWS